VRSKSTLCIVLSLSVAILFGACTTAKNDHSNPVQSNSTITLTVQVEPSSIPADGSSRSTVFVEIMRGDVPVNDSTEVILLRTIGSLGRGIVYTHNGTALDTLTSDTTAGSGWLIAYSGGVRDSAEIMFTARH
jgi:hypothetical protein